MTLTREQIQAHREALRVGLPLPTKADGDALCDLALSALPEDGWVLFAIKRPEGYEDVHPDLLAHDAFRDFVEYRPIPEGADQRGAQGGPCPAAGSIPVAPHHFCKATALKCAEIADEIPLDHATNISNRIRRFANELPAEQVPPKNGSHSVMGLASAQRGEPAELLPCPFCGGEAGHGTMRYSKAHVNEQGWSQDEFYFVNCIVCGSNNKGIVGFDSPERAIAAWNRRTPA